MYSLLAVSVKENLILPAPLYHLYLEQWAFDLGTILAMLKSREVRLEIRNPPYFF